MSWNGYPAGWNLLSWQNRQTFFLEALATGNFILNRPVVTAAQINVVGDTVPVKAQLLNCQLTRVVAFTTGGVLVSGATLLAKISGYVNTKLQEQVYFNDAILTTDYMGAGAHNVVNQVIQSNNITINLTSGHGLGTFFFFNLGPGYLLGPDGKIINL